MEKEEVLRRSHNTFRKSDPYENHLKNVGQLIGCAVVFIVSTIVFFLQRLLQGNWNFALFAAIPLLLAVESAIVGIKLRKKKEIIEAIIIGGIAITFITIHVISLLGV